MIHRKILFSIYYLFFNFSYIIVENDLPGKFDIQKLQNAGIKPGPFCSRLKAGETVTLDDGRVLCPTDYVGSSRPGRRIVILGDCSDASNVIPFADDCDVLVHECTHENKLHAKALEFGHSTPAIATGLAEKCRAKCLLLNHFSQRYKPRTLVESNANNQVKKIKKEEACASEKNNDDDDDNNNDEDVTVDLLLEEARKTAKGPVFIADDFFTYTISAPK